MEILGFENRRLTKSYYTDGHEREDIVKYRDEYFLPRMAELTKRSVTYVTVEDELIAEIPINSNGEKVVVIITHDEMTVYSNECKSCVWMENGKQKMVKKTKGKSIMVSGFCCDCHGFFSGEVDGVYLKSYEFFEAGKGRDGWYNNDDLVKFLIKIAPLIRSKHPDMDIVLAFDNSMSHHKKAPNALDATALPLKDGGKNTRRMRDTKIMVERFNSSDRSSTLEEKVQKMQNEAGEQKGIKTILIERRLWVGTMLLECQECKDDVFRMDPNKRKELEEFKDADPNWIGFTDKCCARGCLRRQDDFRSQKEWLAEECEKADFQIIYYPKYHCELNYIESIWAYIKCKLRRSCTFNYNSMVERLKSLLDGDIPLELFQKTARCCQRMMDGYRMGLKGPLLDYASEKYRGHRAIPQFVTTELNNLQKEFEEKMRLKRERKLGNARAAKATS